MKVEAKGSLSPKPKAQDRLDETIMEPGEYEVTPSDTFTIDLYLRKAGKIWQVVNAEGKDIVHEQVVFRLWSYHEIVDLRKRATSYDSVRRVHMIDFDLLNRLKVQKLLQSWTLDSKNPRMKLHRVGGVLTDEAWELFSVRLQPGIASYIIDRMNRILEPNV